MKRSRAYVFRQGCRAARVQRLWKEPRATNAVFRVISGGFASEKTLEYDTVRDIKRTTQKNLLGNFDNGRFKFFDF